MFWPCETRTSTCCNFATISSGVYRFFGIAVLLHVKRHSSGRTTSKGEDQDLQDPLGLRASLDRPAPRDPLGQPAQPDQRARRVTPARHRQFGLSPVRMAFA